MMDIADNGLIRVHHPAELAGLGPVAFALGTFDGVHLGHQAVLRQLVQVAKAQGALPAALFFAPSPKEVLSPANAPLRLSSMVLKEQLLAECGVQAVVCCPFTEALSQQSPEEYLLENFLAVPGLKVSAFCVGAEWRFGCKNSGNVTLLQEVADRYGVQVHPVPPVTIGGERVSSTRIRNAVKCGNLTAAAELLGRNYLLEGTVISGNGIASTKLSCPTANLEDPRLQLPPYGVYAARTSLAGEANSYPAIIYIGDAPTVRGVGNGRAIMEIHLLGVQKNLYDRSIRVELVKYLRGSQLFDSQESLMQQIQLDLAQAKEVLSV